MGKPRFTIVSANPDQMKKEITKVIKGVDAHTFYNPHKKNINMQLYRLS